MNIKCVIVDDEQSGIYTLECMLEKHCPHVKVLKTFQSSVEALKEIRNLQPDLLFLDIKMPDINGFKFLEILGPDTYNSIFVTAHQDEYMLQALRLYDIPYLKKPFDENELICALESIQQTSTEEMAQIIKQGFEIDLNTKFGIKEGRKRKFVKLSDINFCESKGNSAEVFLVNGKNILSSYSLGKMDEKLPDEYFFRCHKKYLINKDNIRVHDKSNGGYVVMEGGHQIPISKDRRDDFLDFIDD